MEKKLKLKEPTAETEKDLVLTIKSGGTIEDVLVKVEGLVFPADFMIQDIEEDTVHPIILGRPFLETSRAVIDRDLAKLTLRRKEETLVIKIHKNWDDECYKLQWKEKKKDVPPTPAATWRMKIEIEELEDDMAQLQINAGQVKEEPHELTNQMQRLAIEVDVKALWVKAWGRQRKVAKRSKFGVNTTPLKKSAADGLKLKFKRIDKEKDRWVNIPRETKEGKPPMG
jgi:hypothetical protein